MQRNKKNLFIRADATTQIGTGHVMRCIALAQAWQDRGCDVTFLSYCDSEALRQCILNEGFEFLPIKKPHPDPSDLKGVLSYLTAIRNPQSAIRNWVVLDGYHFTPDYQKAIRDSGYRLLVIDDMAHQNYYHADILVNQNINAPELNYSCDKDTTQLLGCNYVMLRREFLEYKNWKREIPEEAKKILVTMGGGDSSNVTLRVTEILKLLNDPDLEIKVVIGPSNPHLEKLQSAIRNPQSAIHILQNVTDMPSLMAWADMAISAGGSTCWEMAFMRVPTILIVTADNQEGIASGLDAVGAVNSLGWFSEISVLNISRSLNCMCQDHRMREMMILQGEKLIDGNGTLRVINAMKDVVNLSPLADMGISYL